MKIIGRSREDFILQATSHEVANLLGYYHMGGVSKSTGFRAYPDTGDIIEVSKMFEQLYNLASAQRELKVASQTLHSIANLLLVADPLVKAVIDPDGEKAE